MSKSAPWMSLAEAYLGTKEIPGPKNNVDIIDFYRRAGDPQKSETVPWCSAFVGAIMADYGLKPTKNLMARSWLNWKLGKKVSTPRYGDIVIFSRGAPPSGHVAFYLSMDDNYIYVLGGNQSDAVTKAKYPRSRLLGFVRPPIIDAPAVIKAINAEDHDAETEIDESETVNHVPEERGMTRDIFEKKKVTKKPGIEEAGTIGGGLVAASQTSNAYLALFIIVVFAALAGYLYYRKRA